MPTPIRYSIDRALDWANDTLGPHETASLVRKILFDDAFDDGRTVRPQVARLLWLAIEERVASRAAGSER